MFGGPEVCDGRKDGDGARSRPRRMKCPRCQLGELHPGETCAACAFVVPENASPEDAMLAELERVARAELDGQFDIERLLGRGGMSVVMLARETDLKRYVAVKVLPLHLTFAVDAAERFKREAHMAASLDHPHIVPIYRVGSTPRLMWYSMKYVRGATLATHLAREGPMSVDVTARFIARVADALQFAHDKGIVHRDVKPGNLMMDERGWAWVTDFGVAKAFGSVPLTQTGGALGTPGYMSPEQYYGQELDGRADQYALAVVAYECLAGVPPFVAESLGEYVHKHCNVPAPDIRAVRADVPPPVAEALLRALRKRPDERFASVTALAEALGAPRDSLALPVVAATTEMESPSGSPAGDRPTTPMTPTPTPPGPDTRPIRPPRRVGHVTAAVAATLVLASVGVLAFPGDKPSEPPSAAPALDSVAPPPPGTAVVEREASGSLVISTFPLGQLTVDGRLVGESFQPNGIPLTAGQHVVRVTRSGFSPYEDTLTVAPGEVIRRVGIPLRPVQ